VSDLNINGDNLHYCGSVTINCTSSAASQNFFQTLNPPCVNITNCKMYGCQNNCNGAGTCSAIGMCRCNQGHYGFDCSVSAQNNCIQPNGFDRTCWSAEFPDCKTIDWKVTSNAGDPLVNQHEQIDNAILTLLPCQSLSNNINCETCIDATDLQVVGTELRACPTVKVTCNDVTVSNYQMNCLAIAKSDVLICPYTPTMVDTATNSTIFAMAEPGKLVLLIMGCFLVLLFLGGLGYFAVTKYFGFNISNPFQQVELYAEDEAPLTPDNRGLEEESM